LDVRNRTVSAVAASAAATSWGSACGCRRGLREPGDSLDDPIEFEGVQGAWVHVVWSEAACEQNL
jgi:hypothetical protein